MLQARLKFLIDIMINKMQTGQGIFGQMKVESIRVPAKSFIDARNNELLEKDIDTLIILFKWAKGESQNVKLEDGFKEWLSKEGNK